MTILHTPLSTKKKTYKISGGQTGNTYQKCKAQGFPGGPVDRTLSSALAFTAKRTGSIPGWGPAIPVSRMGRQKTKQKWQNTIFLPHKIPLQRIYSTDMLAVHSYVFFLNQQ